MIEITEHEYRRLMMVDEVMNPDGDCSVEDFQDIYDSIVLPTKKESPNLYAELSEAMKDEKHMEKVFKKLENDVIQKQKQITDYYESEEFIRVYETLVEYLKENEIIDDQDVMYDPENQPISKDDFYNLINSIEHYNKTETSENEHRFPQTVTEYKNLIITTTIGQGSYTKITLK